MRRIDLTCLIVSPIAVGCIMTYASAQAAVLAVLAWNLAAWAPECLLAAHAVRQSDALQCVSPWIGSVLGSTSARATNKACRASNELRAVHASQMRFSAPCHLLGSDTRACIAAC